MTDPETKPDAAGMGHNYGLPAYDAVRKEVEDCKLRDAAVDFNYADKAGNVLARSHVHKVRGLKGVLEKVRVAEKAESLALGKRIDEQAKEILGDIETIIERHAGPLKDIEDATKLQAARTQALTTELATLETEASGRWMEIDADVLEVHRKRLAAMDISEAIFGELSATLSDARDGAVLAFDGAIEKKRVHAAEQAELDQLRAGAAKREEADRVEAERVENERLAAEAEKARVAEEARIREEEKAAAETERLRLIAVAEQAEKDRIEAEKQAEADRKQAEKDAAIAKEKAEADAAQAVKDTEERVKREAAEAEAKEIAEAEKRERNKKHRAGINGAAVKAMVAGGLSEQAAKLAITMIAKREIPAVTISY